jgi:signal transduction histidine kinase/ligand-binding sensor domain-containing protein
MAGNKSRSDRGSQVLVAILLFFWLVLNPSGSVAAPASGVLRLTQLDHKVWTIRDGAPGDIMGIAQDEDGTLWLTGLKGLYQFDGLKFQEFHAPTGESDLPPGGYNAVFVARNRDVWVGSLDRGIARIRGGRVRFFNERDGFPSLTVMQISGGPDGSIWAVVHGRLMVLDGNRWTDAGTLRGIPDEGGVRAVFFDHEGTQWVSTARRIYYRSPGQPEFSRADINFRPGDSSNFAESKNGELWIAASPASSADLRQLDVPGHRVPDPVVIHLPSVNQITFASDGSLWVAGSELNRFEQVMVDGKQRFFRENLGTAKGLTSSTTQAIFEDRNGDMWLGTPNGLERFQDPVLIKYVDRPLDSFVLGLARDAQGTIWIGSGRAPLLSVRSGETREHGPLLSRASVLFPDSRGAIWIKTDDGIVRDVQDHLMKVDLPKGVPVWAPRQFFEVKPGEVNVSFGSSGVFRFVDGKWFKWDLPNQPNEVPGSFFVDKEGQIWIGYYSGKVGMVDKTAGSVFPVGSDTDLGSIHTFLESSEGLLCGGVNGIAIFRGHRFDLLPTADPASITGISGMVQTGNGDIWLNGIHGVSRIAYSDFRAAVSHRVPLPTQLFTQTEINGPTPDYGFPTAVTDANGRVWFNTSGVIAFVDPGHVLHNTRPPTLVISTVEEDGQPVGQWNQVKASTSTIRIPYFGANLFAPEKVKYTYWLHGVDKTWQDVGRRTEAVYTHLGPGRYSFEVKATNGEGVWSAPISTSFTVLPAFHQTIWFAVLCVLAGVLLLWLGLTTRVRYVTAGIRLRAEERANERIRIARELHDTLLQGVQGLLLSFHAAASKVPSEHESKRALERALTRADQIILEGRNRVTRLRSENLTDAELKSLIESVAADLNGVATMNLVVDRTGGSDILQSHVLDEVFCIAREALTNSFRHSAASQIAVALDYQKREFTMTCRDNGRGFDPVSVRATQTNGHWGLRGMAERAENIGAKLSFTSAPDEGTEVHFTIPARLAYVRPRGFWDFFARNTAA